MMKKQKLDFKTDCNWLNKKAYFNIVQYWDTHSTSPFWSHLTNWNYLDHTVPGWW